VTWAILWFSASIVGVLAMGVAVELRWRRDLRRLQLEYQEAERKWSRLCMDMARRNTWKRDQ
jgi:hypothetical protein